MASINIPAYGEALAAVATATGLLQVADTTKYAAGAEAWLSDGYNLQQHVRIMQIVDATHMLVQFIDASGSNVNGLSYGMSDASAYGAAAKASVSFAGGFNTVLQAHTPGVAGNIITVALVGDSAPAGGVTIARTGTAFIIHYESGVSTVSDVETAVTALAGANDLIDVKTGGTGATVLTAPGDNHAATNLSAGTTSRIDMETQTVRIDPAYNRRAGI